MNIVTILLLITILVVVTLINSMLILPLVFFLTCVLVIFFSKKKIGNWLNIFSLISVIYILGFILRYITLIYGYNQFNIPDLNMTITLIYSFAIYIFFLLGSLIGFKVKTISHLFILKPNKFETRTIIFINLLITIGNSVLLLAIFGGWDGLMSNFSGKSTSFSGLGVLFVFLSSLAISLIILIAIGALKINLKISFLIILSLLPLLTTGGRILLILTAFSYLLAYEFSHQRFKLYHLLFYGFLGIIFYLLYFSYFRVYNLTGDWDYLFSNIGDLYYNTLINGALSFIDGLNVIMYYVPDQVNYLGGYSLVAGLLIFVPSAIITNKPDNTAYLYNLVFNQSQYSTGTGQNPSLIGEVYWNLGPLNTLIIFFIVGILIGILYKKAFVVNFNPKYLSVITLIFLVPITLFVIKSGISSGTPYRILIPLMFNLILLFLFKKIGWGKNVI